MTLAPHIERVLDAARTAPSHHNAQPWRFLVDGEAVAFFVDHERCAPSEAGMARVAIGAALECVHVAAARMGSTVRPRAPREGAVVEITVGEAKRLPDPDLARMRRVTNRRIYDGRAIDDDTLRALREATPQRDLAQTHWFGRERVRALGPIVEEAEDLFFSDATLRERALASIRFDVKDREDVTHGLAVASLELQAAERAALVELRKPSGEGAVAAARKTLAARARKQMESASGVCILTTSGREPSADVDVGRSTQRAWMTLTQRGLAAHPMTAILALGAGTAEADADTVDNRVLKVLTAFRGAFPNVPVDSRIAMLLRFGYADAPTCRVGRLALEESLAAGSG